MEDRAESKLNSMRLTTHVRISDKSARSQHNIAVLNKVQMDIYIYIERDVTTTKATTTHHHYHLPLSSRCDICVLCFTFVFFECNCKTLFFHYTGID